MSWLDALLGRIRSLGVDVALGNGLNFTDNLRAVRNESTGFVDVSVEGPQGPTGATGPAGPTGATGATGPAYAGSSTVVTVNPASGSLGVIDISTLDCGGVVTLQSLSEATIDGFTAKTDGFWFVLHIRDTSTAAYATIVEDVGSTTTSVRTSNTRDWRLTKNDSVMLIYRDSRWRLVTSYPKTFLPTSDSVTWAAQQDNFARTGRGISTLRVTLTGAQTLTGVVPDGSTPGGELLLIQNIDASETLTIDHDAVSTAANRFLCPGGVDVTLTFGESSLWRYDATSSRWRMVSRT